MDPLDWLAEHPHPASIPFPKTMIPGVEEPTRLQVLAALVFKNHGQLGISSYGVSQSGCPLYDGFWGLNEIEAAALGQMGTFLSGMLCARDEKIERIEPAIVAEWERCKALQPEPSQDAEHTRSCRVCGCTDLKGCIGGCSWAALDLCSACAPGERAMGRAP